MNKNKKIAVFFDCDNISPKYVKDIFNELAKLGDIIISQAYADWGRSQLKSWKEQIPLFAIKQIQTTPNTSSKKNVADFQILIDIMDIMNNNKVDTIVIVSSDSDFTSLIINIKSKGFEVMGFGESKTIPSIRAAYNDFIELPIKNNIIDNPKIVKILINAINNVKDDNEYVLVSQVGTYLKRQNSSYNPKNYGGNTWGDILKKYPKNFKVSFIDERKSKMCVELI